MGRLVGRPGGHGGGFGVGIARRVLPLTGNSERREMSGGRASPRRSREYAVSRRGRNGCEHVEAPTAFTARCHCWPNLDEHDEAPRLHLEVGHAILERRATRFADITFEAELFDALRHVIAADAVRIGRKLSKVGMAGRAREQLVQLVRDAWSEYKLRPLLSLSSRVSSLFFFATSSLRM